MLDLLLGLAFLLLMFALSSLVDPQSLKIPFWTLFMVYVIQSVGELCLSPIGLSMVTKLAAPRNVGLSMGGMIGQTFALKYPGVFKTLESFVCVIMPVRLS